MTEIPELREYQKQSTKHKEIILDYLGAERRW